MLATVAAAREGGQDVWGVRKGVCVCGCIRKFGNSNARFTPSIAQCTPQKMGTAQLHVLLGVPLGVYSGLLSRFIGDVSLKCHALCECGGMSKIVKGNPERKKPEIVAKISE